MTLKKKTKQARPRKARYHQSGMTNAACFGVGGWGGFAFFAISENYIIISDIPST
jgi:hypothetical protein